MRDDDKARLAHLDGLRDAAMARADARRKAKLLYGIAVQPTRFQLLWWAVKDAFLYVFWRG